MKDCQLSFLLMTDYDQPYGILSAPVGSCCPGQPSLSAGRQTFSDHTPAIPLKNELRNRVEIDRIRPLPKNFVQ